MMRDVRSILADLCSTKLSPEQFALIAELSAAAAAEATQGPAETPEDRRKRVSRETSRRHRASRNVTGVSPDAEIDDVTECHEMSPGDAETSPPRAGGLDKPLRLVTSGDVVAVAVTGEPEESWPKGDPAKALIAAIESPWLDPNKSPGLVTTAGRVTAWRRDGASWQHDVLPVVTGMCANRRSPISSWKFFDAAIGQTIADNRRALEIPEASTPRQGTGPPHSFAAQLGAEQAEVRRRILAE